MKIYIITIKDDFYINPLVKWMIRTYHNDLAGITFIKNKNNFKKRINMLGFAGTIKSIYLHLKIRLIERFRSERIIDLIKKYNIPYDYITDVNNNGFVTFLKTKKIDIIFSFCSEIYKEEILKVPKIGIVNRHCSNHPLQYI